MFEWTPEDEAAEREGNAIRKSNRTQRPRKPHGVSKLHTKRKQPNVFEKYDNKGT